MRCYRGYRRRQKIGIGFFPIAVGLIALLVAALLADAKVRPIVASMAQAQAVNLVNDAIDDTVTAVLSQENTEYDDLVRINTDIDGKITSIQSRTVEINRLKSALSSEISETIAKCDKKRINIPVGTITGSDLLAGRGPRIHMYITLSSSTQLQISNYFESTGINQTRHQILLDVTAKVYIIMTGADTSVTVQTNFVVAETVIVGGVPDTYLGMQEKSLGDALLIEESTQ